MFLDGSWPRAADQGAEAQGEQVVRTFRDDANREWEVRAIQEQLTERRTRLLPRPELAQGWLLFTCGEERRRFDALPPGWALATDGLLRRWCDDAAPVMPLECRWPNGSPPKERTRPTTRSGL